jgi:prepilin-type N-terminal cleavage/methylation domain-containing protein
MSRCPAFTKAKLKMNLFSKRNPAAFTLIEMIAVMLIIATLVALFVGAASNAFDRARRAQAKNDVIQIVTAVNAFYTEYGKYPVPSGTTTDAFFGSGAAPAGCTPIGNNDLLFNALRGLDNTTNPRAIVFLSPGGAKNTIPPRGGIATDNRYYDPWGSQYAVAMDSDYNNQIGTANPYSDSDGSAGTTPLRFGAVAYSFGKNGALGGGAAVNSSFSPESGAAGQFKGSSDILSW